MYMYVFNIGGRRVAVSYATSFLPKFFAAFLVSAVLHVLFLCLSRRHAPHICHCARQRAKSKAWAKASGEKFRPKSGGVADRCAFAPQLTSRSPHRKKDRHKFISALSLQSVVPSHQWSPVLAFPQLLYQSVVS